MSARINRQIPAEEKKEVAPVKSRLGIGSSIETSLKITSEKVDWLVENRGGFAKLTGFVLVPSQFLGPKAPRSEEILERAAKNGDFKIERFNVNVDWETSLQGVIYYPENWDPKNKNKCVLYHNPNGVTLAGYFRRGDLDWTPGEILKLANCPIIMYDYRGTGLSSENESCSSMQFRPTYESVVADGEAALYYALDLFKNVTVVGSSLGGGVATVSLDRHLKAKPEDANRVQLYNHDSFTNTPRVVMPNWPRTADWAGWAAGGLLEARHAMANIIGRKIPVTILCHTADPVIPRGARMAEYVHTLEKMENVKVIYSPYQEHASLTPDMVRELGRI